MDAKEEADRMAAAEALYMISKRVEKPQPKSPRKSRRQKNNTSSTVANKNKTEDITPDNESSNSDTSINTSVSNSKRVVRPARGRGKRGGRGVNSVSGSNSNNAANKGRGTAVTKSDRGKGRGRATRGGRQKSQENDQVSDDYEAVSPSRHYKHKKTSRVHKVKMSPKGSLPQEQTQTHSPSRSRLESFSPTNTNDSESQYLAAGQAVGLTGAAIIPMSSSATSRRNSIEAPPNVSTNLSSIGLMSNQPQFSRSLSGSGLPSMNLTSVAALPSIPLEIGSLQLSSQPTPNLCSFVEENTPVPMEVDESPSERAKSEKFLPLKKRKLHKEADEVMVKTEVPSNQVEDKADSATDTDSEDHYEAISESSSPVEPVRQSFTVQAPPIITMQTLMEIKTALTPDDDGDLPLHIAVVHENMRMVDKLICLMRIAGKGVDKFNKQQQTPLHLAVKLEFLEAVDILLKSGANVDAVDCTGSSSIHMAVLGKSTDCLSMLLNRCPSADLNTRNFDGLTPLHLAVDNGDLVKAEMLLKRFVEIDVTDGKSGRTSLFRAAESNQRDMVELLLRFGANPEVPNYAGVTSAMAAQGRNLHGVMKLLGSVPIDKCESEIKAEVLHIHNQPGSISRQNSQDLAYVSVNRQKLNGNSNNGSNNNSGASFAVGSVGSSSNETKVFHNVFLVSQKSPVADQHAVRLRRPRSEPNSPKVKVEMVESGEETDRRRVGQDGLLSLPEGLLLRRDSGEMPRSPNIRTGSPKGIPLPSVVSSLTFPSSVQSVSYRGRSPPMSGPAVNLSRRGESSSSSQKHPVMLQIVQSPRLPGHSPPHADHHAAIPSLPSTVLRPSSPASSSFLSPGVGSVTYVKSPSENATNTPEPVTLTGIQARLYQKLLESYSSTGVAPHSPGSPQPLPGMLSKQLSATFGKEGVPHPAHVISKSQEEVGRPITHFFQRENPGSPHQHRQPVHPMNIQPPLRVPAVPSHVIHDPRGTVHSTSGDHPSPAPGTGGLRASILNKDRVEVCPSSSPPVLPLNLSTNDKQLVERDKKEDGRTEMEVGDRGQQVGLAWQSSGQQSSSQRNQIISIGVRRLAEGKSSEGAGGQYEMYLIPTSSPASSHLGAVSPSESAVSSSSHLAVSDPEVNPHADSAVTTRPGSGTSMGGAQTVHARGFPHISQKTAAVVHDAASKQIRLVSSPTISSPESSTPVISSLSLSSSTLAPPTSSSSQSTLPGVSHSSSLQTSGPATSSVLTSNIPKVKDLSLGLVVAPPKRDTHLMSVPTNAGPIVVVTEKNAVRGHVNSPFPSHVPHSTSSTLSPSPTTKHGLPAHPIWHQGTVVDLSSRHHKLDKAPTVLAETLMAAPAVAGTNANVSVGEGRIVGFSGAILSVFPPPFTRPPAVISASEVKPVRDKEVVQKEAPKKRGRKSLKAVEVGNQPEGMPLGKINSETDEKLKKFLGSKKREAWLSSPASQMNSEGKDGKDATKSERQSDKSPNSPQSSHGSSGFHQTTYRTVGIFSGDIQHVDLGKRHGALQMHAPTLRSPASSFNQNVSSSTVKVTEISSSLDPNQGLESKAEDLNPSEPSHCEVLIRRSSPSVKSSDCPSSRSPSKIHVDPGQTPESRDLDPDRSVESMEFGGDSQPIGHTSGSSPSPLSDAQPQVKQIGETEAVLTTGSKADKTGVNNVGSHRLMTDNDSSRRKGKVSLGESKSDDQRSRIRKTEKIVESQGSLSEQHSVRLDPGKKRQDTSGNNNYILDSTKSHPTDAFKFKAFDDFKGHGFSSRGKISSKNVRDHSDELDMEVDNSTPSPHNVLSDDEEAALVIEEKT